MPRKSRPTAPLSATETIRSNKYGTERATVTANTGALLTSYQLQNITVKKLAEEAPPAPLTEKQKKDKERTDILGDLFDKFTKEQEEANKSAFDFVNEVREAERPVSPTDITLPPLGGTPPSGSSGQDGRATPFNSPR